MASVLQVNTILAKEEFLGRFKLKLLSSVKCSSNRPYRGPRRSRDDGAVRVPAAGDRDNGAGDQQSAG